MDPARLRVVCVTPGVGDSDGARRLVDAALAGGATAIWIRERGLDDERLSHLARHVTARGGLAIVSGRVVEGAGAVHLGFRDDPPPRWRDSGVTGVAVGYSAHDPLDDGAIRASDYVTLSPLFETVPKSDGPNAPAPIGPARFRELVGRIAVPVVALGGIDVTNAHVAIEAGAVGVAVLRGIAHAFDPRAAAAALRHAVDEALS